MEDQIRYREDLKAIREIMQRSTRFISLSGLSGITAGIIGLLAAYLAGRIEPLLRMPGEQAAGTSSTDQLTQLIALGVITLLLAVAGALLFTLRSARKNKESIWNIHFRQLLIQLAIPLFSGGILSLFFAFNGLMYLVPSTMLIFYGLALVGASKYTLRDIFGLGVMEIILGLTGLFFPGYELWIWACGFGLFHIIYGVRMYINYGS